MKKRRFKSLLSSASKSKLMNIQLEYGEETYNFNLYEELKIVESNVNNNLLKQPQVYSFLTMLHKKLIALEERLDTHCKKVWSEVYLKYKEKNNTSTGRPNSDDLCKAKADSSKLFIIANKKYIQAKENRSIIEACMRAFEQRKDMLQTISANLRKET